MTDPTNPAVPAPSLAPAIHPTSRNGLKDLLARQDYLTGHRPTSDASIAERLRYNDAITALPHRPMQNFIDTGTKWIERHQGRMPSKWLGIEGSFHSGKTEMAVSLALNVCRAQWKALGDEVEDAEGVHVIYPVAYLVVGGDTTEKQVCQSVMTALDIPEPSRKDTEDIPKMFAIIDRQMRRSRTVLLVIDDLHHMGAGRGRTVTKFFKQMFSTLPCTLLFVADCLSETWLLKPSKSDRETQVASQQLSMRKIVTSIQPIATDASGIDEWVELVRLCLDALVLRNPDSLTGVDYDWLLRTCKGDRVDLLETMLIAGRDAVGGSERIAREGLEIAAREHGILS